MNRDQLHQAASRCRFTKALWAACATTAPAALLLVSAPAAAQLWPDLSPPEPVQEGVPPPDWLAGACAGATPDDKCSAVDEAVPVGELNIEAVADWAARVGTHAGTSYGTAPSGSVRIRPVRKCDSLEPAAIKRRIWDVAERFFESAGFEMERASGPHRLIAYGPDERTRKIHLFADIDLRSYNPARLDGLGCNIQSSIYVAWREDGRVRVDNSGRARELRRALRQDLSS